MPKHGQEPTTAFDEALGGGARRDQHAVTTSRSNRVLGGLHVVGTGNATRRAFIDNQLQRPLRPSGDPVPAVSTSAWTTTSCAVRRRAISAA